MQNYPNPRYVNLIVIGNDRKNLAIDVLRFIHDQFRRCQPHVTVSIRHTTARAVSGPGFLRYQIELKCDTEDQLSAAVAWWLEGAISKQLEIDLNEEQMGPVYKPDSAYLKPGRFRVFTLKSFMPKSDEPFVENQYREDKDHHYLARVMWRDHRGTLRAVLAPLRAYCDIKQHDGFVDKHQQPTCYTQRYRIMVPDSSIQRVYGENINTSTLSPEQLRAMVESQLNDIISNGLEEHEPEPFKWGLSVSIERGANVETETLTLNPYQFLRGHPGDSYAYAVICADSYLGQFDDYLRIAISNDQGVCIREVYQDTNRDICGTATMIFGILYTGEDDFDSLKRDLKDRLVGFTEPYRDMRDNGRNKEVHFAGLIEAQAVSEVETERVWEFRLTHEAAAPGSFLTVLESAFGGEGYEIDFIQIDGFSSKFGFSKVRFGALLSGDKSKHDYVQKLRAACFNSGGSDETRWTYEE